VSSQINLERFLMLDMVVIINLNIFDFFSSPCSRINMTIDLPTPSKESYMKIIGCLTSSGIAIQSMLLALFVSFYLYCSIENKNDEYNRRV